MTEPYPPHAGGGLPQPYGQPYGQPYPPVPVEHPQANTVLVLGIVGAFVPVVSFVAWFMGSRIINENRLAGLRYSNEQNLSIGRILGIVFSVLQIVTAVLAIFGVIIWLVFVAAVVATAGR